MKALKLDCWNNWTSLPWNQISERIFILQKKIYQASKTCKYCSIYKMQNTLFNSIEAKVLAIEEIFKSLSKGSIQYNQEYYQFNNRDKFFIFHNLFQKQNIAKVFAIVIEKIKQYLIYLCIQPEWEARFDPILQSNINGIIPYLFQEKLIRFLDYKSKIKHYCSVVNYESTIVNKYINPEYITQKIQSSTYLKYCLITWLDNQFIEELNSHSKINQDLILNLNFNIFHKLLYRIICNGIEWFYAMTLELELKSQQLNIYKGVFIGYEINTNCWTCISSTFIDTFAFILKFLSIYTHKYNFCYTKCRNNNFYIPYYFTYNQILAYTKHSEILTMSRMKIANNLYKILFNRVKCLLYKKDSRNKLRANVSINTSKVILGISKLLLRFYNYYCLFLSLKIVKKIYKQVDFIVYSWAKKNHKNRQVSKISFYNRKKYLIKSLTKSKKHIVTKICVDKLNR